MKKFWISLLNSTSFFISVGAGPRKLASIFENLTFGALVVFMSDPHQPRWYHAFHDLKNGWAPSQSFSVHSIFHCTTTTKPPSPALCSCNNTQNEVRSASFRRHRTSWLDLQDQPVLRIPWHHGPWTTYNCFILHGGKGSCLVPVHD